MAVPYLPFLGLWCAFISDFSLSYVFPSSLCICVFISFMSQFILILILILSHLPPPLTLRYSYLLFSFQLSAFHLSWWPPVGMLASSFSFSQMCYWHLVLEKWTTEDWVWQERASPLLLCVYGWCCIRWWKLMQSLLILCQHDALATVTTKIDLFQAPNCTCEFQFTVIMSQ